MTQVEMSPDGNIAIADVAGAKVSLFNHDGEFVKQLGSKGSGPSQYYLPASLTVTQDSYAVADFEKRRVNIYGFDGSFERSFIYTPQNFAASRILYLRPVDAFVLTGNRYFEGDTGGKVVKLLHFYDSQGKFSGSSFLTLKPSAISMNLVSDDRLVIAREASGTYLCAVPFTDTLYRIGAAGEPDVVIDHAFKGFKQPEKGIALNSEMSAYNAWELSWTPIVAVASSPSSYLIEYQTFDPLRYTLIIYSKHDLTQEPRVYKTNSLLLSSESGNTLYFDKNVTNVGDQPYELIEGTLR
jgi:hypothetical protein